MLKIVSQIAESMPLQFPHEADYIHADTNSYHIQQHPGPLLDEENARITLVRWARVVRC